MNSPATSRLQVSSRAAISASECAPLKADDAPSLLSDESLMARLQAGDKGALGELFQRYVKVIRRICKRILRDDGEAEDLAQDVFLFIDRKCSIFDRSKSSARSWIVQMTYSRAFERRRRLISRHFYNRENFEKSCSYLVGERMVEVDYCPEAVFGRNGLEKVLGSLSKNQRETLRLHFFYGYTFAEISEQVGQPLENVRHHYYRGLDKLRRQMFG